MATLSFRAYCQKDHDRVDFTDREAFESHMTSEHKAKRLRVGGGVASGWSHTLRCAPGWSTGGKFEPYPWKAPAVPRDWQAKLAKVLSENPHDVEIIAADYVVPPAQLAAGDVFTLGGENYRVLDTDTDRLEIEKADNPERRRWFTVTEVAAKRDRVRIVKRAA